METPQVAGHTGNATWENPWECVVHTGTRTSHIEAARRTLAARTRVRPRSTTREPATHDHRGTTGTDISSTSVDWDGRT